MANINATLLSVFNFYKVSVFTHLDLDDSVISGRLFIMSKLFVHTARAVCSSYNNGCILWLEQVIIILGELFC